MHLPLNDFLQDFPHVALASLAENDELLEYYHQTELAAKSNTVIYKRGNDFFQFLKERSENFLVFTLRDDNKKLQGVGVASYRLGHINGELTTIGYLGDLRVSMNRKLIREWRNFYGTFIKRSPEIIETNFCKYYQTALMATNVYSKSNLVDTKIPNLHYKELATYQMVNIIGKIGFSSISPNVRFATALDKNTLIEFLQADHQRKLFGHDWDTEFERRLNTWKNFKIEDYVLYFDSNHKIIAATSVWNPIASKQIIVPQIPVIYKLLEGVSKFIPGFKLKPLPKAMLPIEILYLNQISFAPQLTFNQKEIIFKNMVDLVFNRNFNMLAYCDFERENLLGNMKHLITQKNSMGFYSVHYKNEDRSLRDELFLKEEDSSPAFDMALV